MSEVELLSNESWRVGVLPGTGASLAFGQVRLGEHWVDLLRPTPPDQIGDVDACADFVLAPWSNRLRGAEFRFRGGQHRLRVNAPDGTAIHGVARDHAWRITDRDDTSAVLEFDSGEVGAAGFPWRFSAEVTYRLDGDRFSVQTAVTNRDREAFPAGFGHHPYFQRGLNGVPDEVRLAIPCAEQYLLESNLPALDALPVPVQSRVDFRKLRPLGELAIDDVLTGRAPGQPVRMLWASSGISVTMQADEEFGSFVVYVPQQGKPYFAVEPVTNVNDGFNLYEHGTPESGVFVLEPGERRVGGFSLTVAVEQAQDG